MKRIISILLIVLTSLALVGCHKKTDNEKAFIEALETMQDDIEYGSKHVTGYNKTYGKNYTKVIDDSDKILEVAGIGDITVDKVDSYVKEHHLEYEYKAIKSTDDVVNKLMNGYKKKDWEKQDKVMDKIIDTYKDNISKRD